MQSATICPDPGESKKPIDTVITCVDLDSPSPTLVKPFQLNSSSNEHDGQCISMRVLTKSPSLHSNGSPMKENWEPTVNMQVDEETIEEYELKTFVQILKQKRLQEKLVYVLVVVSIILLTHSVLAATWLLPYYYSISAPVLLIIRTVMYCYYKWQYFLLDFCYFGNVMFYIFIWALPNSPELFAIVFSLSNGPLLWAMVIYRNSLVFHSIDKVTSVFIHFLPSLLSFVIRWYPVQTSIQWYTEFVPNMWESSIIWLVFVPTACFVVHSLLYILVVFILLKPSEDYVTSYRYFTGKEKGFLGKVFNILGPRWRFFIYNFLSWVMCSVSLFAALLWYQNFTAHCVFLCIMFSVTVYNGASYYMDIFSVRGFSSVNQ